MNPAPTRPGDDFLGETAVLLAQVHEGDEEALRKLLERHLAWLEEAIRRELHGDARRLDDTGDHLGEVVCKVLTTRARFVVEDEDSFRRILLRIVRNTLTDRVRYHGANRRDAKKEAQLGSTILRLDRVSDRPPTPGSIVAQNEELALLEFGLELLAADQREVLLRRDRDKWSFARIAESLGDLSESGAAKKYQRAKIALGTTLRRIRAGEIETLLDEAG